MNNKGLTAYIEKYAKVLVILAVVCGATSGPLGKAMTAPPIAIGFWRLTMGLPFFAIPVLTKNKTELKQVAAKDKLLASLSGVFLCLHFTSWFNAIKMTTIASASILAALHPLVVLAISIILYKKKIGPKPLIGIIVALIGAAVTAGFDYGELTREYFIGDLFGFGAAFFMGLYFAIGERVRGRVPGNVYVFILFTACWLSFIVEVILTKTPLLGYPMKDYLLLVAMTLLCQIGSHALYNLCLGHVDSVYVSTWGTFDTVCGILMAMVFLGQVPAKWAIAGCIIVVAGLVYYNRHADE